MLGRWGEAAYTSDLLRYKASSYAFLLSVPPWTPSFPMTITNAGVHKETKQSEQNYLRGRAERKIPFPTNRGIQRRHRFIPHHPALLIKFPELRLKLTARKV